MFDWDSHYEDVVATTRIQDLTEADGTPRWRRWARQGRALAGRWTMAGAVALGMYAAGSGALTLRRETPAHLWDTISTPVLHVLGLDDSALPPGLLAYDQTQYDRFRHGIARFTDAELLDYARVTQRDLDGSNAMAAYTHDALLLAHREIDRRGLHRPLASLRDAFQRS